MTGPEHVPVLLEEVTAILAPEQGERVVVDATIGAGGHAERLLAAMGEQGRLIGIDRDPQAIEAAGRRLGAHGERVRLVQGNFDDLEEIVGASGWGPVHGVLYDLGVSSMHFDRPERGFSYQHDAPLDMRMDPASPVTAAEICNTFGERELTRILREYGEERWAARIAKFIVAGGPSAAIILLQALTRLPELLGGGAPSLGLAFVTCSPEGPQLQLAQG